jgi:hypothetical protein
MLTPTRTKALEYAELAKTATNSTERLEFRRLESSLTALADNEQWLKDNQQKLVEPESLRPVPNFRTSQNR